MKKEYIIKLSETILGTTHFEKADPTMGVVFGIIQFASAEFGYEFFKSYCIQNQIQINEDFPEEKFLSTQVIPGLTVFNESGKQLIGEGGNYLTGMEREGFEITILGYPWPDFGIEFPHHVKS